MRRQGGGRIVVTASNAGLRPEPMVCYGYAASKAAVIHMVRHAALELAADNILVNAICPGPFYGTLIGGGVTEHPTEEMKEAWATLIPLGRMAHPGRAQGARRAARLARVELHHRRRARDRRRLAGHGLTARTVRTCRTRRVETNGRPGSYSQSLERGLAILSSFRSGRPLLGVSDLAREVGLSRSTTHRYIATLAGLGYLQQDPPTRKYRLGPRVLDLGFSAINSMDLRELAAPHLQALSDETGHTVNMAVLDGPDIMYIERCRTYRQGQRDIDLNLHIGSRLPAYCTSMGKVLLANLPPDRLKEVLRLTEFHRRGPNTLTAKADLLAELERVREAGLARQQRGARVRAALDRRAGVLAERRGRRRRSTSPCTARWSRSTSCSRASPRRSSAPPPRSRRGSATRRPAPENAVRTGTGGRRRPAPSPSGAR